MPVRGNLAGVFPSYGMQRSPGEISERQARTAARFIVACPLAFYKAPEDRQASGWALMLQPLGPHASL